MKSLIAWWCAGWLLLAGVMAPAHAALDIEIVGAGEHQIPVSIVPFAGEEKGANGYQENITFNDAVYAPNLNLLQQ